MKFKKGEFGYIDAQKKRVLIWTIFLFGISIALYITGIVTTGSNKNLLTIVAVLGFLPASKSLVNTIMFFRAKGCLKETEEKIAPKAEGLSCLYDLYLTTYKKNYPISHMVLKGNVLCGFADDISIDANGCQAHLDEMLKQGGYKNITVKIFTKLDSYLERLDQLQELDAEPNVHHNEIMEMLLSISL